MSLPKKYYVKKKIKKIKLKKKKYYVYVFINFILYNNLTTQMMADKAETLKASANTPLAKTLMGATSSQSRVKFVKSFLYTQPIIWMNNYNNLH